MRAQIANPWLIGVAAAIGSVCLWTPGHTEPLQPPSMGNPSIQFGTARPQENSPNDGTGIHVDDDGDIHESVDDSGDIYRKRHYGGIVPEIRNRFDAGMKSGARLGPKPAVTWVGFQHRQLFSRVFVQTDRPATYHVYKPDPMHIHVEIPGASVPTANDRRELDTSHFDTPVKHVIAIPVQKRTFRGTRIIITLDRPAGYLYKQDGDYVFVDIER